MMGKAARQQQAEKGRKESCPCRRLGTEQNLVEAVRPVNLHSAVKISMCAAKSHS